MDQDFEIRRAVAVEQKVTHSTRSPHESRSSSDSPEIKGKEKGKDKSGKGKDKSGKGKSKEKGKDKGKGLVECILKRFLHFQS